MAVFVTAPLEITGWDGVHLYNGLQDPAGKRGDDCAC